MTISAQIIADSISPEGIRLTTMQLRYPRFIHAEFMTHRLFSRNASSSRAIPVARMIEDMRRDPAMPVFWGSNKPGMQAGAELPEEVGENGLTMRPRHLAKEAWLEAMQKAIEYAEYLIDLGLHKQIANRILEPWAHINVVVTATDWANFFALRAHADAQPEIKALAEAMQQAMVDSEPQLLQPGEWHLPFVTENDKDRICFDLGAGADHNPGFIEITRKVSVARCARVSYLTHDGRASTVEEDVALYDRLVGSQPLHASPAEHQATPDELCDNEFDEGHGHWLAANQHGNFRGWIQYRKTLPGEFIAG